MNRLPTKYRSKSRFRVLIIIAGAAATVLVNSDYTLSQPIQNDDDARVWVDFGFGLSTAGAGPKTDPGGGFSARAAFHFQADRVLISVPVTTNAGGKSKDGGIIGNRRDTFNDLSVLFGFPLIQSEEGQFVFSLGISTITGSRVTTERYAPFCFLGPCEETKIKYTKESFGRRFGVPIEIGYYNFGDSEAGTAIVGHINFNGEELFAGITLNMMLGKRN